MSNNQMPRSKITQRGSGFFQDLADRFRLVSRLIMDSRVNPLIKILPISTLVYLISPIDLLSVNPIDDALIIWLGTSLFVELCPPNVVEEHMNALRNVIARQWKGSGQPGAQQEEVVDGEYIEIDPNTGRTTTSR
ncbi:MAG: hypothetical protein GX491_20340 [Chloroflexi bacterium]|nr:hypothetical protein [Chloroflexota bacterium]